MAKRRISNAPWKVVLQDQAENLAVPNIELGERGGSTSEETSFLQ